METLAPLEGVLCCFQDLFGSQNFVLFCAYVWGVIVCSGRHTESEIYQASGCQASYWSLIKFVSRGKWDWQKVCARLIWIVLPYLENWVYIYDHTKAIKTGMKQSCGILGLPLCGHVPFSLVGSSCWNLGRSRRWPRWSR